MKKLLFVVFLLAAFGSAPFAHSQVFSFSGDLFNRKEGRVRLRVLEAGSEEPVPYASVYLTASNDTLITNFTLTDTTGRAELTRVTLGTYDLTVELLGYKTYRKEHYFSFTWQKDSLDAGTVHLEQDTELLEAARVSAVGNPIEIRQDTVIFNASSFMIGENAMLEDLLKRMPGMEVSKSGTITYNGETIPRITVGGKTFFSDDPSMALKNLPAKIVDKVKVIDKASDAEQFTGVASNREKVMDLEFKKEFQQGWFGNAKLAGGATLAGERKEELIDNRGMLYNSSVMVSGYNEKDQLTVIGNAYNAPLSNEGSVLVIRRSTDDENASMFFDGGSGIQTYQQLGANFNTTRLKGLETSSMASYGHSFNDSRSLSSRRTFVKDGSDILSDMETKAFTTSDNVKVGIELKNTSRDKFLFSFTPSFVYSGERAERYNDNETRPDGGEMLNRSSASNYAESKQFSHDAGFLFGINNLGKKRRSLTLSGNYKVSDFSADSREYSEIMRSASSPVTKDLFYVTDNRNYDGLVRLIYSEPLSERWILSTTLLHYGSMRNNGKDAFNRTAGEAGFNASVIDKGDYRERNDYYSSVSKSTYVYFKQSIQFQYQKKRTSVQLGVQTQETLNEMYSKSLGNETTTGQGEWLLDWNPYFNLRWSKNQSSFSLFYSGSSSRPSAVNQLPVLDISVPTRLRAGNIYLQPQYRHLINGSIYRNNPQQQWNYNIFMNGGMVVRPMVTASWFDSDGIQYSIPVNSRKPSLNAMAYASGSLPLTRDKRLQVRAGLSVSETRAVSFQNTRQLSGLDIEHFDYTQLMEWFWGADGDLFYSGRSGFSESITNSLIINPSLSLRYRGDAVTVSVEGATSRQTAHYSLDSAADTKTWSSNVGASFDWVMPHSWEFSTDASYRFYAGYPQGYNEPFLKWNAGLTRNIKAWALGFYINDILNSARNTRHVTTENYVEDTMRNMLGRHFFISVKWNFGKLNAAKDRKASNAMFNMMF